MTKAILATALLCTFACSRTQEEPSDTDDEGSASGGASTSEGTGTEAGGSTASGSGTDSDSEGDACVGPGGCYDCAPTDPVQVLNRCTDASCEPFDNVARLPLLNDDGTLPPLP